VASSWLLFFSYQNDARSNKHQILRVKGVHEQGPDESRVELGYNVMNGCFSVIKNECYSRRE